MSGWGSNGARGSAVETAPSGPSQAASIRWGAAVIVAFVVGGLIAGALWEHWATPVKGLVVDDRMGPAVDGIESAFDQTGVFVTVTAAVGLVLGLGLSFLGRRHVLTTTITVIVGGLLAGPVAYLFGRWLGPGTPPPAAQAEQGTFWYPLNLRGVDPGSPLSPDSLLYPWPNSTVLVFALTATLGLVAVFLMLPSPPVGGGRRPTPLAPAQPSASQLFPNIGQNEEISSARRSNGQMDGTEA